MDVDDMTAAYFEDRGTNCGADMRKLVSFASSLWFVDGSRCALLVDCTSGRLFGLGTNTLFPLVAYGDAGCGLLHREVAPADFARPGAAVDWMEEYARRLTSGVYSTAEAPSALAVQLARAFGGDATAAGGEDAAEEPPLQYISLMRNDPEANVEARTRGVVVQASPQLVVALSALNVGAMVWTYRIRMRMCNAMEADGAAGAAASSGGGSGGTASTPVVRCQLARRKWYIQMTGTGEPEVVDGEAVIGLYPKLSATAPEDEWFQYQSCTSAGAPDTSSWENGGAMWGTYRMVPGTLAAPEGEPFEVVVPRFTFRLPRQEAYMFC